MHRHGADTTQEEEGGQLTPKLDEWAARAQSGDRTALDAVASGVWRLVYAHAKRLAVGGLDVDDLAQEGLAQIQIALRSWNPSLGGFLNYFAHAALRRMCRYSRRQRRPAHAPLSDAIGSPEVDHVDLVSDLESVLRKLPPDLRSVFARRHGLLGHEPHSQRGVAEAEGLSVMRVRALLVVATESVRRAFGGAE